MQLTVRYFAAARAAAGAESVVVDVEPATTVGELEALLAAVLPRCSYLRDEIAVRDRNRPLGHCTTLDVLPPFAGG